MDTTDRDPPPSLDGRVAVITGAGRGIGRALALALAAEGARVLVNDAGLELDGSGGDPSVAAAVADEIAGVGGTAVADSTRVGAWSAGESIVAAATTAFGESPSIVISNAAILRDRMSFNVTHDEWASVLETNLHGAMAVFRAALPGMRERRWGRIVNITSTAGLIGNVGQLNYAAAKGGLVAATRVIALDTARYGITANSVAPFAYTRMTERIQPTTPELAVYLEGARKARPEHVAPLVVYLCSERSSGVTGQVFGVRGREVMVFNQPRVARSAVLPAADASSLDAVFDAWIAQAALTPVESDLELFRYQPLV